MNTSPRKTIVILGMMTKIPVAGNVWLVIHYMLGFQRLGCDVYYVEAHGRTPSMFMETEDDDGTAKAAAFIDAVMRRFDLHDHWAYHAVNDAGRCYGRTVQQLADLYARADLIINLHGSTIPQPEHFQSGRLMCLETDPVELEIELYNEDEKAQSFLRSHAMFFTWGENYGSPDCQVPMTDSLSFRPTRAPVLCDMWKNGRDCGGANFTTIGNWRQAWRNLTYRGEEYTWSKHHEFLKFVDLPSKGDQVFELALSSYTPKDERMLKKHGWHVCAAMDFSTDLDGYRQYIRDSRGEFTVAKDQNVRLKSGWFSERSAQYLAASRPVITQETGFSNVLPTGRGLFAFSTIDDILAAVESINSDYEGHCRAASEIAREYFNYDVVLTRLLEEAGV